MGAILFLVTSRTGHRPIEVGPDSTETGASIYGRLWHHGAVAQIYWYEGGRWDDRRAGCPIRRDVPIGLRCAVAAEMGILLTRKPHWSGYLFPGTPPKRVAEEARLLLDEVGAQKSSKNSSGGNPLGDPRLAPTETGWLRTQLLVRPDLELRDRPGRSIPTARHRATVTRTS